MLLQKAKLFDGDKLVAANLRVVCESVPNTMYTHSCNFQAPDGFQPDLNKTYNLYFERHGVSTECRIDSFHHDLWMTVYVTAKEIHETPHAR